MEVRADTVNGRCVIGSPEDVSAASRSHIAREESAPPEIRYRPSNLSIAMLFTPAACARSTVLVASFRGLSAGCWSAKLMCGAGCSAVRSRSCWARTRTSGAMVPSCRFSRNEFICHGRGVVEENNANSKAVALKWRKLTHPAALPHFATAKTLLFSSRSPLDNLICIK